MPDLPEMKIGKKLMQTSRCQDYKSLKNHEEWELAQTNTDILKCQDCRSKKVPRYKKPETAKIKIYRSQSRHIRCHDCRSRKYTNFRGNKSANEQLF